MKDLRLNSDTIVQVCGWGSLGYFVGNVLDLRWYNDNNSQNWKDYFIWSPGGLAGGIIGVSYGLLGVPLLKALTTGSED